MKPYRAFLATPADEFELLSSLLTQGGVSLYRSASNTEDPQPCQADSVWEMNPLPCFLIADEHRSIPAWIRVEHGATPWRWSFDTFSCPHVSYASPPRIPRQRLGGIQLYAANNPNIPGIEKTIQIFEFMDNFIKKNWTPVRVSRLPHKVFVGPQFLSKTDFAASLQTLEVL